MRRFAPAALLLTACAAAPTYIRDDAVEPYPTVLERDLARCESLAQAATGQAGIVHLPWPTRYDMFVKRCMRANGWVEES